MSFKLVVKRLLWRIVLAKLALILLSLKLACLFQPFEFALNDLNRNELIVYPIEVGTQALR